MLERLEQASSAMVYRFAVSGSSEMKKKLFVCMVQPNNVTNIGLNYKFISAVTMSCLERRS